MHVYIYIYKCVCVHMYTPLLSLAVLSQTLPLPTLSDRQGCLEGIPITASVIMMSYES